MVSMVEGTVSVPEHLDITIMQGLAQSTSVYSSLTLTFFE